MGTNPPKTPQHTSEQTKPLRTRSRPLDAAFNIWLERGLHQLYDPVAQQPIPDELLKLIEAHK